MIIGLVINIDTVPVYLLIFFLKIRKHENEKGYLLSRVNGTTVSRAVDEQSMARELEYLHLIGLSDKEDTAYFESEYVEIQSKENPNMFFGKITDDHSIPIHNFFVILARGRYIWTEILSKCIVWLVTSVIGAFIGAYASIHFIN